MKLIEIGDGLKSIEIDDNFVSDWEYEHTVLIYDPKKNDATIRITVISLETETQSDQPIGFENILKKGQEKGFDVTVLDDKCFYSYVEDCEEDEEFKIIYFEVGFKNHIIIISITVELNRFLKNSEQKYIDTVINLLKTIKEISLSDKSIFFDMKLSDINEIKKRISEILEIEIDEIEETHRSGKTIEIIQHLLDSNKITAEHIFELQSIGLAFGDYFRHNETSYKWVIVRDQYGRDYGLRYINTGIIIFPMTMISKRIEDGEKVIIKKFLNDLKITLEELINSKKYI